MWEVVMGMSALVYIHVHVYGGVWASGVWMFEVWVYEVWMFGSMEYGNM